MSMKQKLLTISVAAYNVADYIEEALSSLIVPEFMDDLEVLIVDDGATDNTLEIARTFSDQYPDTFIPVHKENGGYGTTVNYSIRHASGKYFKLLDGDDWFDNDSFRSYLSALKTADEDIIITPMYNVTETRTLLDPTGMDDGEVVSVADFYPVRPLSHWYLTIRTELLRESGVKCLAHTLYTDQIFSTVPFSKAKDVRCIKKALYSYRLGRDGQSMSRESRIRHINDLLRVNHLLYDFCESHKECEGYDYILRRTSVYYMSAFKLFLILPTSRKNLRALKTYERKARTIWPDIYYEAEVTSRTGSLLSIMRKTNYLPYWLFTYASRYLTNF